MGRADLAVFLLCLAFVAGACGQHVALGRCPSYKGFEGLNLKKFGGKWYEVERSFYLYEIASSCTSLYFNVKKSGTVRVAVKSVNRWTGSPSISLGTAVPIRNGSATISYQVNSRLPDAVAKIMPGVGLYTILDTNYDDYALLWSCTDLTFMHADLLWVLGRKRELPVGSRAEVYNKLAELNIDSDRLTLSRHDDCPLF